MSNAKWIIAGFASGLAAGIIFAALHLENPEATIQVVALVGEFWLDAVQMAIIPLVFSLIITGIASAFSMVNAGAMAARILLVFGAILVACTFMTGGVELLVLHVLPIPKDSLAAIRSALGQTVQPEVVTLSARQWVSSIIPTNPIASAANGNMVQMVLFAIVFSIAVTRLETVKRDRLINFFDAIADSMLVIIHWALLAAPVGVFALTFSLGAKSGVAIIGALAHYVTLMVGLCIMLTIVAYLIAVLVGGVPFWRFFRAMLSPQAVAASTQSSIATLPAMIETARDKLHIPVSVTAVVLPMAVAVFRITSPSLNFAIAIYCAHIFGIELTPVSLLAGMSVALLMNFAGTGVPGQANFFTTVPPICMAMGVPITALPLLVALEAIPDIFKTVGNVTADVALAAGFSRNKRTRYGDAGEAPIGTATTRAKACDAIA